MLKITEGTFLTLREEWKGMMLWDLIEIRGTDGSLSFLMFIDRYRNKYWCTHICVYVFTYTYIYVYTNIP